MTIQRPLDELCVLEIADGLSGMCGRYLADLGATVRLIEPSCGVESRNKAPLYKGKSLYFESHHCNKESVVADLEQPDGRQLFYSLLEHSDILIANTNVDAFTRGPLNIKSLMEHFPELVIISITDFGLNGPYKDFTANNAVHMALTGQLARSGIKGHAPLLPPGDLAYETTAIQAAWAALIAYWQRLNTGLGDHLDFSVMEGTAQILDPALGATGSAAAGKSAKSLAPRGRPPVGAFYPIFPCADGYVRVCILNPRQWAGMSAWLGEDHPFTDPSWGNLAKRFASIKDVNALIAKRFSRECKVDLVKEGQQRGVPIAAVATPSDVLKDFHFHARKSFIDLPIGEENARLANGYIEIDGTKIGLRTVAPSLGNVKAPSSNKLKPNSRMGSTDQAPFANLRVLDLGVIVAGAELGRLFADQGADVIKVENHAFPDGLRQSRTGDPITESFAQGSRGKRSLGLNLRSEKGLALFKQLIAKSDIVLSNFKPGTMDSLGLGYEQLKQINPAIIVADSSALGSSGPLSKSMGYGPLVRASTGLTGLWRYPEMEHGYADGITIYPDHFAARITATAILSLLIRREKTGLGGTVSQCQAEAILGAMTDLLMLESLTPNSLEAQGNRGRFYAPSNIFSCAGDDEWCVISAENDQQWQALCSVIGKNDLAKNKRFTTNEARLTHADEIETHIQAWAIDQSPDAVMASLQAAGVPAAKMMRVSEIEHDPQLKARGYFRELQQPGLSAEKLLTENGPSKALRLPNPRLRPAPFMAQHTEEIAKEVLGLSDAEISELVSNGDLELMKSIEDRK